MGQRLRVALLVWSVVGAAPAVAWPESRDADGSAATDSEVLPPIKPAHHSVPAASDARHHADDAGPARRLAPAEPPPVPFTPDVELSQWYVERGDIDMPNAERIVYCHAYNCALRQPFDLDADTVATFETLFAEHAGSPAEERVAIGLAEQAFERMAAPLLGGPPDAARSDFGHAGRAGQTDCLDEATNTTSLLIYLQAHGLLHYHHVLRPEARGALVFLYAHATAVIADPDGEEWAIDSWPRASGEPPDILPMERWRHVPF